MGVLGGELGKPDIDCIYGLSFTDLVISFIAIGPTELVDHKTLPVGRSVDETLR